MSEIYHDICWPVTTSSGVWITDLEVTAVIWHNDATYVDDLDWSISYYVIAEPGNGGYEPLPDDVTALLAIREEAQRDKLEQEIIEVLGLFGQPNEHRHGHHDLFGRVA